MSEKPLKEQVLDLLDRLGISGRHLRNARLGPGVVGRNSSIAWALEVVMLAGVVCGGILRSPVLVGVSLGGAIVVALTIASLNVHFGKANPAAALLEGAEFVEFHHMQLTAAKDAPPTVLPGPPVPPPSQLGTQDRDALTDGER